MRLDFFQFVVTGPSISTVTQLGTLNGNIAKGGTVGYATQTQCLWVIHSKLEFDHVYYQQNCMQCCSP